MAQIRVTAALSAQYGIPIVIHIMDDWPAVLYRRGLVGPIIRRTVMKEFHSLLRKASARLVISTAMAEDYKIRFGYSFLPFHNALDLNEWRSRSKKSWHASHPFVVRYAGSIIENSQRDALRDIVHAVSELRRSGNDVEMWIHSPAHQRQYLVRMGFEGLHLAEPPPPESIIELLTTADLLVLPFNFDSGSADYIRLSMPTKVPAYMASGTPVLVYGPKNIAAVQYALDEGWAYVLSQPGVAGVQSRLQRLMSDESLRQSLGRRAQSIAVERHDAARVRAEFQAVLAGAV
jgi:glycosyltransferase involved in cell wall biosynthesis